MKAGYEARDEHQAIAHIVEECGEVIAAAGKAFRFGPMSTNPELPPEKRETNIAWFSREIGDLERAIKRWRELSVRMVNIDGRI